MHRGSEMQGDLRKKDYQVLGCCVSLRVMYQMIPFTGLWMSGLLGRLGRNGYEGRSKGRVHAKSLRMAVAATPASPIA